MVTTAIVVPVPSCRRTCGDALGCCGSRDASHPDVRGGCPAPALVRGWDRVPGLERPTGAGVMAECGRAKSARDLPVPLGSSVAHAAPHGRPALSTSGESVHSHRIGLASRPLLGVGRRMVPSALAVAVLAVGLTTAAPA